MDRQTNPSISDEKIDEKINSQYDAILSEQEELQSLRCNLDTLQNAVKAKEAHIELRKKQIINLCHEKFDRFQKKYVKISHIYFTDGTPEYSYGYITGVEEWQRNYCIRGFFLVEVEGYRKLHYEKEIRVTDNKFSIEEITEEEMKAKLHQQADEMFDVIQANRKQKK